MNDPKEKHYNIGSGALDCYPKRVDLYEAVVPLTLPDSVVQPLCEGNIGSLCNGSCSIWESLSKGNSFEPRGSPSSHSATKSVLEETHPERFELTRQLGLDRQSYFVQASISKVFQELQANPSRVATSQKRKLKRLRIS